MSAAAPQPAAPLPGASEARGASPPAGSEQANGQGAPRPAAVPQSNGAGARHDEQQDHADEPVGLPEYSVGWAQSPGNRPYQDDRRVEFLLELPSGGTAFVWAVADGHHKHHVSQLVCDELPSVLSEAVGAHPTLEAALHDTVRRLDDVVFARHAGGQLDTGGTTLLVHVLTPTHVYTANVGDCKSVLSSRGACVELNTCHNPNVASERDRFQAVGIYCSADHIGGSDINVCRTLGDYDLGMPLKGRDTQGRQLGPLISEPEVGVLALDEMSEFVITASDGLWDYYSPESSVLSDTRRTMRRLAEDPQQVAEWLLDQALAHQARTLHHGTPGDNITIVVVKLRPLPPVPRGTGSRLCLARGGSGDLVSPKLAELPEAPCSGELSWAGSGSTAGCDQQLQRRASQQESTLLQQASPRSVPSDRH